MRGAKSLALVTDFVTAEFSGPVNRRSVRA
jgi:hypothetical protein